jgi:hypothetical protein
MSDVVEAMAYAFPWVKPQWVILRTHPPTAMNRETGELIDLPEPPEERCPVCRRWHG